jgi:hypothetical protein
MKAMTAHVRYISKNGRLEMEDERGETLRGRDAVHALSEDWRFGGSLIDEVGHRREAFNLMLSMPRGTDPLIVHRAAREFAQAELADHKYVMVLHDHQANPHVHISVRAESKHGHRLNPRKADLQRWRETFAEKLRGWGIEAEATRQATRGGRFRPDPLWKLKAQEEGRLGKPRTTTLSGQKAQISRTDALEAWLHIGQALAQSEQPGDVRLAGAIARYVQSASFDVERPAPELSKENVAPSPQLPSQINR